MSDPKPWHEDNAFWKTFAPKLFGRREWDAAPMQVDQIIALLEVEPPATILDLCCGPGRHSLELARRGYRVTGVDRTAWYLEQARGKAKEDNLEIEFVQEDMRRFVRPNAFDGVINVYTSFGYFEDADDDRHVLDCVRRSLRPGGTLVMDVIGKEVLARIFQGRYWYEEEGVLFLGECKVCRNWTWSENRWIMFKDGQRHEHTFGHRLYSAVELSALLTHCGFPSVDIFGDLAGAPYDHQAKRLVARAKK